MEESEEMKVVGLAGRRVEGLLVELFGFLPPTSVVELAGMFHRSSGSRHLEVISAEVKEKASREGAKKARSVPTNWVAGSGRPVSACRRARRWSPSV